MYDLRMRAIEWQLKRSRLKRVVVVFGIVLGAVVCSALWDLVSGAQTRWLLMCVIGMAASGGLMMALSAYTNTAMVAMYYMAQVVDVEKLELVTGTIEEVRSMKLPYVGTLHEVTLSVVGEKVHLYCSGKLLQGVSREDRLRVWSYDMFAVKVETTVRVDVESGEESARSAS